ncbi:MAG TPA: ABC transporter permease [Tepidisphaeraceae bacterium]|nr:ABC transporter permease [Tepidisphaeraceae bacterium]
MRWFICVRYLLSHLRQTLVCIAGVVISVIMFIAMTAMMRGFSDKFIIETVESTGHITINDEPRARQTPILQTICPDPNALLELQGPKPRDVIEKIKNPAGLIATVRRMPLVVEASPIVKGDAVITYGTKTYAIVVEGVEPDRHVNVTTIGQKVTEGAFLRLKMTSDGIVLGRGIAITLGVKIDDLITITSSTGGRIIAKVVGIFSTGVTPVDYSRGYMQLSSAQTLLNKKNIVNEIVVRTSDYTRAREIAAQIEEISGYKTESWQEANENFLKIFRIQTIITYFITGALLVVAAFGVLNILIMAVLERVNDIAILKSFGFSRADITQIYLLQGMVIGLIGSMLGLVLGKIAVEGLRRLPIQMEGLIKADGLLMSEHISQYVTAFVGAMAIVLLASVYPARRAARYDPVEVIRGAH